MGHLTDRFCGGMGSLSECFLLFVFASSLTRARFFFEGNPRHGGGEQLIKYIMNVPGTILNFDGLFCATLLAMPGTVIRLRGESVASKLFVFSPPNKGAWSRY